MNCKQWLLDDLKDLGKCRFAVEEMKRELQTIAADITAIKTASYDMLPSKKPLNGYEERLIDALAKKSVIESALKATKMHIRDMDTLLSQLSDDERLIISRMIIAPEENAVAELAHELGYEKRQLYNKRDAALCSLLRLRFGVGYNP